MQSGEAACEMIRRMATAMAASSSSAGRRPSASMCSQTTTIWRRPTERASFATIRANPKYGGLPNRALLCHWDIHGCGRLTGNRRFGDLYRRSSWWLASLGNDAALCKQFFNAGFSGIISRQHNSPVCAPMTTATSIQPDINAVTSQVFASSDGQPLVKSNVLDDDKLLRAMVYEAQNGFSNVSGLSSRFGDFLFLQVTLRATMPGGTFSLLEKDSKLYDQLASVDRADLLDRVAQAMGFLDTQDLIAHHFALREASQDLQGPPQTKISPSSTKGREASQDEASEPEQLQDSQKGMREAPVKPVPSAIVFGSSEPIELYNPTRNGRPNNAQPSESSTATSENVTSVDISKSKSGPVQDKVARLMKKKLTRSPVEVQSLQVTNSPMEGTPSRTSISETERSTTVTSQTNESTEELLLMKGAAIYKDCVLDMPVSFIKNLSVYQRSRLEESGFHTLRMLLQHFPRTYVNFQQAGQRVEDGQHLSFVGTIISSRGLRLGPSLGAVEIVVKSKVDAQYPSDEDSNGGNVEPGKIVFLHLKKFFRGARFTSPWFLNKMAAKHPLFSQVAVGGRVKALPLVDHFEIREYNLEVWDQGADGLGSSDGDEEVKPELEMIGKPYPVYPSKGGLQPKTLEFCIRRIIPVLPMDLDPVPRDLRDKFGLIDLRQAYFGIHTPSDAMDAERARQRLVFDEFFYLQVLRLRKQLRKVETSKATAIIPFGFSLLLHLSFFYQLGMLLQRQQLADRYLGRFGRGEPVESGLLEMEKWSPLTLKLVKSLPYSLTKSQQQAASEIMWDLQQPIPMSRLLQGDVGCGKTVVAFLGLLEVIDAGYQGALMAPTEFLAIQHFQRITSWLEVLEDSERPRVALLTGSTPTARARVIRNGLETGEIALAVGTHSLISDSVRFASLGLAVVDEQHRFGVAQRGRLNSKVRDSGVLLSDENADAAKGGGEAENEEASAVLLSAPHVLAMSATPIPRTLALAMHGDMSISQITELPPGRPETITETFHGNAKGRWDAYKMVREELESGGRVFVVYPVIGLSEELPDLRAAEIEYETLAEEFKDFQCGLVHGRMKAHEKEAAMELFKTGKSQILVSTTVIEVGIDIPEASMIVIEHAERYGMAQLHQLRGRVGRGTRDSKCILLGSTSASLNRLELLERSNDGFYLAEIDLRIRGPGDLLGKRQSGHLPEFGIARLDQDGEILENARAAAEEVLRNHHGLRDLPRLKQELSVRRPPRAID